MATGFILHSDCLLHEMGRGHPESPARLDAVRAVLQSLELTQIEAALATREQLALIHTERHIDFIEESAPTTGYFQIDGDTTMNSATWQAALRAAGSGIAAVDAVMAGRVDNVFCAVRPPGHHAEPDRSMGFCLFNNIAIAAKYALSHYGLERVALIDFDVHHGNGSEVAFQNDPAVLMCSFFQSPLYPYSGLNSKRQNMVNIPVPAHSNGEMIRTLVRNSWLPALEAFRPEFIFISAGFDAHEADMLAQLELVEEDYAWITKVLVQVAKKHAQGRMVSCLEGGYHLGALASSSLAHVQALMKAVSE
jgi:acetoin utilization deacetylase AcuC-like enzyme